MGTRNRLSVARPCCRCVYQASDGNAWGLDPFDSLDSDWITQYPLYDTFAANGRLTCSSQGTPPGTSSNLYRTASITSAGLKVIVEAEVYSRAGSATMGVYFTVNRSFAIFNRWNYGNIGLYAFGSFVIVGSSIQSSDKLSLRIEQLSDDQYRVCYHQNGQRIHEVTGDWTFSSEEHHGVTCTPGGAQLPAIIGEWDNYSCHIGNP